MRFGLTVSVLCLAAFALSGSANAQETVTRAEALTPLAPQSAARQAKSAATEAATLDGLYLKPLMSGLGDMRGLARDSDGTVYTLDQRLGRLYALSDRGGDGRLDGRRVLMDGLNTPSGLTVMDGAVVISDAAAVWAVDIKSGERRMIAPLTASGSDIAPRPLLYHDAQLWLGLNKDSGASVVRIDPTSGRATLVQSFESGPITVLAAQGKGRIWAGVGNGFAPLTGQSPATLYAAQAGAPINGLSFAHRGTLPEDWPDSVADSLSGRLILTQGAAADKGGYTVVAVASEFGQPSRQMRVLLSGFYNARSDKLWAYPDALLMTPRGLLMGDRYGTLWQLSRDDRPKRAAKAPIGTPLPEIAQPKPSQPRGVTIPMQGSLLGKSGSSITQGSTITTGSVLLETWEAEKAEAEAKAVAEKKQKRSGEDNSDTGAKNKGTPELDIP